MTSASTDTPHRRLRRQRKLLETLALPAFREATGEGALDDIEFFETDDGGAVVLRGLLGGGHLMQVAAAAGGSIDAGRTELRFTLLGGFFAGDIAEQALMVGNLLDPGPFHVQADFLLGACGQMSIGCDLVVRADDEPLLRRRLAELIQLADDLEWFFPLRMPGRIRWPDTTTFEIEWPELPHDDLEGFLEAGLDAPPAERTPLALVWLAMGMRRWKDVLRLLREHPDELPSARFGPLKVLALRELGRWLPALEAAAHAGIRDGMYQGAPWLSPSYMHALIEAGKDIEALEILGRPIDGEPGFYDWLRGLALHRAGDPEGAGECFRRYFERWPGDLIGRVLAEGLAGETDP